MYRVTIRKGMTFDSEWPERPHSKRTVYDWVKRMWFILKNQKIINDLDDLVLYIFLSASIAILVFVLFVSISIFIVVYTKLKLAGAL